VTREGFYSIHRPNHRDEMVAVHADRLESDLAPMPPDNLELWRNTGRNTPSVSASADEAQARPWSLWRYALLLVLLIAIFESIFASRYLTVEKEAA